jgi:hypothetical protein
MPCHSVGCGVPTPIMLSDTLSFTAAHIMRSFAFTINAGNVIETQEHKGQFKEW